MQSLGPKIKITRFICGSLKIHSKVWRQLFLQLEIKTNIHKTTSYMGLNASNKKTKREKTLATKEL